MLIEKIDALIVKSIAWVFLVGPDSNELDSRFFEVTGFEGFEQAGNSADDIPLAEGWSERKDLSGVITLIETEPPVF